MNGVFEFKKVAQSIFGLKITFILHCDNDLLTDFEKSVIMKKFGLMKALLNLNL